MLRILAELIAPVTNGAMVVGVTVLTLMGAATAPAKVEHNGFACVRPHFTTGIVIRGGTPTMVREFAGFLPCHETYEEDKNGFMAFPEA